MVNDDPHNAGPQQCDGCGALMGMMHKAGCKYVGETMPMGIDPKDVPPLPSPAMLKRWKIVVTFYSRHVEAGSTALVSCEVICTYEEIGKLVDVLRIGIIQPQISYNIEDLGEYEP